jgi:hypothetical protein
MQPLRFDAILAARRVPPVRAPMLRAYDEMPAASEVVPSHFAIEAHLSDLIIAIDGRCPPDRVRALWNDFERDLMEHFDLEERTLLADLLAARPREARVVLEEHRYLRTRLAQLRATLPNLSAAAARTFLDELAAHAHHEERVLYRWAESRSSGAPKDPP